jgi:hypothetical protein
MEEHTRTPHPRSQLFLDTVAVGSLLVFASVMPPLTPRSDERRSDAHDADAGLPDEANAMCTDDAAA